MTHTKFSLQCFNEQDAPSIGQNYRMTSETWFTSVMSAKGMQQEAQTSRETDLGNTSNGNPVH